MNHVDSPRFQFSLRDLLLSMIVVAAALAVIVSGIRNGHPLSVISGVLLGSWAGFALVVPRGHVLRLIALLVLCMLLFLILAVLYGPRVE